LARGPAGNGLVGPDRLVSRQTGAGCTPDRLPRLDPDTGQKIPGGACHRFARLLSRAERTAYRFAGTDIDHDLCQTILGGVGAVSVSHNVSSNGPRQIGSTAAVTWLRSHNVVLSRLRPKTIGRSPASVFSALRVGILIDVRTG